jgi:hypothetical protein
MGAESLRRESIRSDVTNLISIDLSTWDRRSFYPLKCNWNSLCMKKRKDFKHANQSESCPLGWLLRKQCVHLSIWKTRIKCQKRNGACQRVPPPIVCTKVLIFKFMWICCKWAFWEQNFSFFHQNYRKVFGKKCKYFTVNLTRWQFLTFLNI